MNSRDIARLAGVSRSTVSRVVNNYTNVPEATRQNVLRVIEQYGYVPHASARVLAGHESRVIGLFMVDVKSETQGHKVSMSSYFSPFMAGVIDHANEFGFYVLAYIVSSPRDFKNVEKVFFNKTIAGGIFIGQQSGELTEGLARRGCKVVSIDKRPEAMDGAGAGNSIIVNANNFDGAYQATSHLIGLGHRRIAHVLGFGNQLSAVERLEGYKKALADAAIPYDPNLSVRGNFMRESGYDAVKRLLKKSAFTAIFFANDSMAIGGAKALQEAGLSIPDDVSIVGFDDIEIAEYFSPPLTTVRLPLHEMSAIAVRSLIAALKCDAEVLASYMVPVELVKRQSCRRLVPGRKNPSGQEGGL